MVDDLFKGPNLWVGVGIALAAPVVLPMIGAVVRPLVKTAIKGYLATTEALTPMVAGAAGQVGALLAEPVEQFQDLVAEAQQERAAVGHSPTETTI